MDVSVDGYTVLDLIGRGGTASVYRARQHEFDREVALKVFAVDVEREASKSIVAELRSLGRLAELHRAIAVVFSSGVVDDGRPYLSMRHYVGGSLQARVRQQGPLPPAEVAFVANELSAALDIAHANGVIHRDVKPANVLLDAHGNPILTDFGIASGQSLGGDTSTALAMMTPAYAAPERLDGEPGDEASDVYSLAATLWALLIGRAPHAATDTDSIGTVIRRVMAGDIRGVSDGSLPPAIDEALRAGLAVDPARRPRTASELALALSAAAGVPAEPFPGIHDETIPTRVHGVPIWQVEPASPPVPPAPTVGPTTGTDGPAPPAEPHARPRAGLLVPAAVVAALLVAVVVALALRGAGSSDVRVAGASVERKSQPRSTTTSSTVAATTTAVSIAGSSADPTASTSTAGAPTPVPQPSPTAGAVSIPSTNPRVIPTPTTTTKAAPPAAPAVVAGTPTPVGGSPAPVPAAPNATAPKPQRITCAGNAIAMQFSPGLTNVKVPQTLVLSDAGQIAGCADESGRGITKGTVSGVHIAFGAIDCLLGPGNGTGSGEIRWSTGEKSVVSVHIEITGGVGSYTGTSTWTIGSGPFAGAVGTAPVSILLGQDRGIFCSNTVTLGTLSFGGFTLTGS